MRKIVNPFIGLKGDDYNCFVCSPGNPIGLHVDFWEDNGSVIIFWDPDKNYEGYHGVIHGGLQATLMDEAAAWTVYIKCGTAGVTTGMEIKYKKPANSLSGKIKVVATVREQNARLATIDVKLFNSNGVLATESTVNYYLFSVEKAMKEFMYPGVEAFFDE